MTKMTRIVPLAGALALAACGSGSGTPAPEQTTDATVQAVFEVPATDVACIRLVASGAQKTTTKDFAVSPGQSTADAFTMNGIPTGRVVFSGSAYGLSCNFIGPSIGPTWIADDLTVTVTAAQPAIVSLRFHGNGSAIVSGDFAGDEYTASTLAGAAGQQASVDGIGSAARLEGPNGIALSGNFLYFIDRNFDPNTTFVGMTVRRLDLSTLQVVTLAGDANSQGTADGPGAIARFQILRGMALSGSDLYVIDRCAVRKVSTVAPFTVTTLLGTRGATNPNAWTCGVPSSNLLDIAVRPSGIYLADGNLAAVYRLNPATLAVSLVAGVQGVPGSDDGPIASAHLLSPTGLVFPYGNDDIFYVADEGFGDIGTYTLIRRVSPLFDSVTTVAGGVSEGLVTVDGMGSNARYAQGRRMVSDGNSLFIGDAYGVRRLDLATAASVSIAGSASAAGYADGVGIAARFSAAFGLGLGPGGKIYVADQGNFVLRVLAP